MKHQLLVAELGPTGRPPSHVVKHHAMAVGADVPDFCTYSLRAAAATNALDHEVDVAEAQEWLGLPIGGASRERSDSVKRRELGG